MAISWASAATPTIASNSEGAIASAEQRPRELRALEVLERIGSIEAQRVLKLLAEGDPQARLTREAKAALMRLTKPGGNEAPN